MGDVFYCATRNCRLNRLMLWGALVQEDMPGIIAAEGIEAKGDLALAEW